MSEFVKTSIADGVLEVMIDRPDRRNAISAEMYSALAMAVEDAEKDSSIRVILLHGGPAVFTAGNDLHDFRTNPPLGTDQPVFRFMLAVLRSTRIVVAGVAGLAVGIGTTVLPHCDLVVAGRGAKFSVPFVDLGLVPEYASSKLLPAMMGRQRASRHLLLSEPFDATVALDCGLVSMIVEDDEVIEAARDVARRLVRKPPLALARAKRLIVGDIAAIEAVIAQEAAVFAESLRGAEFAEAAAAFFEKRPPHFAPPGE